VFLWEEERKGEPGRVAVAVWVAAAAREGRSMWVQMTIFSHRRNPWLYTKFCIKNITYPHLAYSLSSFSHLEGSPVWGKLLNN
jgi:hypothetical protein